MKLLLTFLIVCWTMNSYAQKKYHCEYKETILFAMPDSGFKSLMEQMEEQGLPRENAEQIVKQLSFPGILTSCLRKIDASPDSTFILVTRNNENDGNAKLNIPDKKLLFRKGEIYLYDFDKREFLADTAFSARRIFEKNQESKIILNHRCTVYTSTDSSCRIWVAEDLPEYINPGIWTGDIKGAVIAYELKQKGQKIHAEITKME
jgi:hypothetical protein